MREENEFVFGEEETLDIVQRYEDMLRQNQSVFFDVIEFESIFDYYLSIDKPSHALEAADMAIRMHPYSHEIQIRRAEVLNIEGKFDEALQILTFLAKVEVENPEVFFLMGQAHLSIDNFNAAKDCFNRALEQVPFDNSFELISRIASLYQERDEHRIAISYLQRAIQSHHYSISTLFEIAFSYEQIGEFERSIQYYNEYLDINPFSTNVWYNLGLVYSQKGDFENAVDAYEFAVAISPNNASALYNLATSYASLDNYSEAIGIFVELIAYEPNNPKVYCNIGECYEKLNQYTKAHEAYQMALSINPAFAEAYYGIAVVMLESKNLEKALGLIRQAISLDETNYDFWLGLGKTLYELNRVNEALDAYKQAVIVDPDEPDAYLGIIEILLYQQKYNEVELLYQEISESFSDIHLLKVIRSAAQYFLGNPIEAVGSLKEALEIEPNSIFDFLELVPESLGKEFLNKYGNI